MEALRASILNMTTRSRGSLPREQRSGWSMQVVRMWWSFHGGRRLNSPGDPNLNSPVYHANIVVNEPCGIQWRYVMSCGKIYRKYTMMHVALRICQIMYIIYYAYYTCTQYTCIITRHMIVLVTYAQALWCSWIIKGPRHSFYFAGDTGYCSGFKQIGRKYGPIDFAAIPIGAYYPRLKFLINNH